MSSIPRMPPLLLLLLLSLSPSGFGSTLAASSLRMPSTLVAHAVTSPATPTLAAPPSAHSTTTNATAVSFLSLALFVVADDPRVILPRSYFETRPDAADPLLSYDLAAKGMLLALEATHHHGNVPVNVSDPSHRVAMNLTVYNIGPRDLARNATAMARALDSMGRRILAGEFGSSPPLVWLPMSRDTPTIAAAASLCEDSRSCIVISSLASDVALFRCANPLPDDCRARQRRVGARRFETLFSSLGDVTTSMTTFLQLSKYQRATSVSFLWARDPFGAEASANAVVTCEGLGLKVFGSESFDSTLSQAAATELVRDMAAKSPDVLIIFGLPQYGPTCARIIDAMAELDWSPKALASGGTCMFTSYPHGGRNMYGYYEQPWHQDLRGSDYRAISSSYNFEIFPATNTSDSPQVYASEMLARFNVPTSMMPLSILGSMAVVMAVKALEAAGTASPDVAALTLGMRSLKTPSIMGELRIDQVGRMYMGVQATIQLTTATLDMQLVMPLSVARDPIWPSPTWSEREPNRSVYLDETVEVAMLGLVASGLLGVVLTARMIVVNWSTPIIRASTPAMGLMTLLGCVMLLAVPLVWNLHVSTPACIARIWLLQLGFTIMFAPLPIKLYRIMRIFGMRDLRVVVMPSEELFAMLAAVVAVDAAFTGIWAWQSPTYAQLVVVDPYRPQLSFYECAGTNDSHSVFAAVAVGIKVLLVVVSSLMGFKTRRVPADFNEASAMVMAVYNVAIVGGATLPIMALELGGPRFVFGVRSIAIVWVACSTGWVLFGTKWYRLMTDPDAARYRTRTGTGTEVAVTVVGSSSTPTAAANANGSVNPGIVVGAGTNSATHAAAATATVTVTATAIATTTATARVPSMSSSVAPPPRLPAHTVPSVASISPVPSPPSSSPISPTQPHQRSPHARSVRDSGGRYMADQQYVVDLLTSPPSEAVQWPTPTGAAFERQPSLPGRVLQSDADVDSD